MKARDDGLVDLDAADVEAVDAAALDEHLAGAMIAWGAVTPAIVRSQAASTMTAAGEALQQGIAFPHGAARLVWLWPRVRGKAMLGWPHRSGQSMKPG